MKVILREDLEHKGTAGSIIEVKPGYARNYLIPRGFAYKASDANLKVYGREKIKKEQKMEQQRLEAVKLKEELEKISLTAVVRVSDEGKLFGSVTSQTVSDLLKEKGYDFSHRKIIIEEQIKELGVYEVKVLLHHGIESIVKVWVVKE